MSNKDDFRTIAKKLNSSIKNRYIYSKKAGNNLKKLLNNSNYQNILFYTPLKNEVDVRSVIKKCRIFGKKIFMPVVNGNIFFASTYNSSKILDRYGIKYRKGLSPFLHLDILIVPILGYDIANRRVGYGKGMYDKFFATLKNRQKPLVVFLQLNRYYSNHVITNSYDIMGDYIIDVKGLNRLN